MPARLLKLVLTAAILTATLAAQIPDNRDDAINRGTTAFKAGRYKEAIEAFQKALTYDPKSTTAIVDLACSYAYQVVPNLDTPENLALADKAIALFRQIPPGDENYYISLKQIATLYRNTKRFDAALDTERQALKIAPGDSTTHYTIGVIDWTQAYMFATTTLGSAGLTDDGVGNRRMTPATCAKIRTHNTALVDDAITHLERAVELNPSYADAMQYLNLVYRRKADFDCANPTARAKDIAAADSWVMKTVEVRKAAATSPNNP